MENISRGPLTEKRKKVRTHYLALAGKSKFQIYKSRTLHLSHLAIRGFIVQKRVKAHGEAQHDRSEDHAEVHHLSNHDPHHLRSIRAGERPELSNNDDGVARLAAVFLSNDKTFRRTKETLHLSTTRFVLNKKAGLKMCNW